MEQSTTRRGLLGAGAGSALALLAGCTGTTPFVGQRLASSVTLTPDDADRISVRGDLGSFTIVGEDRSDVAIDIVKQSSSLQTDLDALTVETTVRDGALEVTAEYDGDTGWLESQPSVDLDIAIPSSMAVDRVASVVGEATIRNVRGDVRVDATTGAVAVDGLDGSVHAESTNGRIELRDVTGRASARTTNGRVEIRDVGELGDVEATNGRIEVDVPAIDGDTRIEATNGRIEAAIATSLDAELVAESTTGSVSASGLPLTDASESRRSLRGQLGEGGPRLTFETRTGRISLEALE